MNGIYTVDMILYDDVMFFLYEIKNLLYIVSCCIKFWDKRDMCGVMMSIVI
jgi:hypothetical protein